MEKKTLYALAALLILGVVAIIVTQRPDKGERVGDKPRPVPEIKADKVALLQITQPEGKDAVTLQKRGDKWQVTAPYDKPADQAAVKSAVESLEKMKWGDISTQRKEQHKEMEVSDDKAVHVVAKDSAGAVLADLYLGKSVGSGTMVRVAGKDDVYQVTELSAYNFKKEGKAWRDHAIFDLKADDAEKLTLVGGGTSVTLERLPVQKGPDGKEGSANIYDARWKVVPGDARSIKDVPAVDDSLVNGIVSSVANLRAGDFVDSGKPEEFGLVPGAPGQTQIEVKVGFKGQKSAGIRIGALKGEDYYVQALDAPQIFTVKKFSLERAAHLPQDIRDKGLTRLKEDALAEIAIQQGKDVLVLKRGDKGWKADKVADADDGKLKTVADSFESLSGTGFIAPGAPEVAALARPKAVVTLKPKSGAPIVLKIGEARGEDVPVQKDKGEPMWVKKYQVERFLKKPSEVTKDKDKDKK